MIKSCSNCRYKKKDKDGYSFCINTNPCTFSDSGWAPKKRGNIDE